MKLESSAEGIAGSLTEQAQVLRSWASALRRAELAADWARVASVRTEMAITAVGVEEIASRMRGDGNR